MGWAELKTHPENGNTLGLISRQTPHTAFLAPILCDCLQITLPWTRNATSINHSMTQADTWTLWRQMPKPKLPHTMTHMSICRWDESNLGDCVGETRARSSSASLMSCVMMPPRLHKTAIFLLSTSPSYGLSLFFYSQSP